jgi:hypothetical protein
VSSCANGHLISPGAESCAVCGDDVRPRCYQGHRSAAGSRFCETCGAMLAAAPAAGAADLAAADLVTEYTSRPFNEVLMEDAGETGDDGAPPRPDADAAAPPGSAAAPASAAAAASPGSAAAPPEFAEPASAANGRPRSRTLTAALGVAVLTAAGVAGGLTLHQRTGQQAQAGPSLGRAPTAPGSVPPTAPASTPPTAPAGIAPTAPSAPTAPPFAAPTAPAAVAAPAPVVPAAPASALPTSSPMPTLTVVPAQRATPSSMEQWAGWIGRRDQYQGQSAAEHDLPRGQQPQQFGERWPGRPGWPGDRWGGSSHGGGPDGGPQNSQHDGGYQR